MSESYSAAASRKRRSDPVKAERDPEASRRWKRENPDAVRAMNLARRMPCPECGALMWPSHKLCVNCANTARRRSRDERRRLIAELWNQGLSLRDIAIQLVSSSNSIGVEIRRMRQDGWDVPFRHKRRI